MLKIALQIDAFETLNLNTDTSLLIAGEAEKRGMNVFLYSPFDIFFQNNTLFANAYSFSNHQIKKTIDLSNEIDFVFIRQNPPFDMNYLTNTYLLDHIQGNVINDPTGIRNVTEKLSTLYFKNFMPETLITYRKDDVIHFLNHHHKIILKPVYECGGRGIELLDKDDHNISKKLDLFLTHSSVFFAQEFLSTIYDEGDKRIFIINGKTMWGIRRQPQKKSFLANLCQEASAHSYQLNKKDQEILEEIGCFLKKNNIFFAGIDLIGSHLIEINVTSPTGLHAVNQLYGICAEAILWNEIQEKFSI